MNTAWKVAAGLAGGLHVLFFLMESVLFSRPDVYARFKLDEAGMEVVRLWALNQGFYNLFLAAGCFVGLYLAVRGCRKKGRTLVVYTCLYMVGAGLVLVASEPTLVGAACVQAVPPLVALVTAKLAWANEG